MITYIVFHSEKVMLEVDEKDPDRLPFVGVRLAREDVVYAEALYTATELRELADKMDTWQEGAA